MKRSRDDDSDDEHPLKKPTLPIEDQPWSDKLICRWEHECTQHGCLEYSLESGFPLVIYLPFVQRSIHSFKYHDLYNQIHRVFIANGPEKRILFYRLGRLAPMTCLNELAMCLVANFTYDELWEWIYETPQLALCCAHRSVDMILVRTLDKFRFFKTFTPFGHLLCNEDIEKLTSQGNVLATKMDLRLRIANQIVREHKHYVGQFRPWTEKNLVNIFTPETIEDEIYENPQLWLALPRTIKFAPAILKKILPKQIGFIEKNAQYFEAYSAGRPVRTEGESPFKRLRYFMRCRCQLLELGTSQWSKIPLEIQEKYPHNQYWYVTDNLTKLTKGGTQTDLIRALSHIELSPHAPAKPRSFAEIAAYWPPVFEHIAMFSKNPQEALRIHAKRTPACLFPFSMRELFCDVVFVVKS
jgi:hypothetical protein